MGQKIVGNDLNANHKDIVIVTGANTGGKSTFLRSVGIAHLMMQAGMFVSANSFASEVCDGIFTHYKREEDASMESGKWDEELNRMSAIVDRVKSNSLLLFNELFASTNEREGSEIASNIVKALLGWLLARAGCRMHQKKLYRRYHEEKLMVHRRGSRKRALGTRAPMTLPLTINQRWSLDFVSDTLSDGRRFRTLGVVDDFSRECLATVVDTSLSGVRVVRELERLNSSALPRRSSSAITAQSSPVRRC